MQSWSWALASPLACPSVSHRLSGSLRGTGSWSPVSLVFLSLILGVLYHGMNERSQAPVFSSSHLSCCSFSDASHFSYPLSHVFLQDPSLSAFLSLILLKNVFSCHSCDFNHFPYAGLSWRHLGKTYIFFHVRSPMAQSVVPVHAWVKMT